MPNAIGRGVVDSAAVNSMSQPTSSFASPAQILTLHRFQKDCTLADFEAVFGNNGGNLYKEFVNTCRRNLLYWFTHYCPYKMQNTFLEYVSTNFST